MTTQFVPTWKQWVRWNDLFKEKELYHAGSYMVAYSPTRPNLLSGAEPSLIYVGETHGPTQNLYRRLTAFGKSSGLLNGKQTAGHYAAWGYPDLIAKLGVGEPWVAICPFLPDPSLPADLRGIFGPLVESITLHEYVTTHSSGRLPPLNNAGVQGERQIWTPSQLKQAEVDAILGYDHSVAAQAAARLWLSSLTKFTYKVLGDGVSTYDDGKWRGVQVRLHGGYYLYLGCGMTSPTPTFNVWYQDDSIFSEVFEVEDDIAGVALKFYRFWMEIP